MSDQIQPLMRAHPWTPSDDATLVEVLNEYNVPLTGLLSQHGVTYLFHCLIGETADANVWAYSPLTEPEIKTLDELTDPEQLTREVLKLLGHRTITFAFASRDQLARWEPWSVGENVGDAMGQFLDLLLDEIRREEQQLSKIRTAAH